MIKCHDLSPNTTKIISIISHRTKISKEGRDKLTFTLFCALLGGASAETKKLTLSTN